MKLWELPYIIIMLFLVISALNMASYIPGVHDCSNMAVEQYKLLNDMGLDPMICIGDFTEDTHHAWIKIGNYEYDPVSLFPMFTYEIFNSVEQIGNTRYYKMYNHDYDDEWQTHYSSYLNSIPTLFILIIFNILRIRVIRKSLNHANA